MPENQKVVRVNLTEQRMKILASGCGYGSILRRMSEAIKSGTIREEDLQVKVPPSTSTINYGD